MDEKKVEHEEVDLSGMTDDEIIAEMVKCCMGDGRLEIGQQ